MKKHVLAAVLALAALGATAQAASAANCYMGSFVCSAALAGQTGSQWGAGGQPDEGVSGKLCANDLHETTSGITDLKIFAADYQHPSYHIAAGIGVSNSSVPFFFDLSGTSSTVHVIQNVALNTTYRVGIVRSSSTNWQIKLNGTVVDNVSLPSGDQIENVQAGSQAATTTSRVAGYMSALNWYDGSAWVDGWQNRSHVVTGSNSKAVWDTGSIDSGSNEINDWGVGQPCTVG